jgi:hypothetical protein
MLTPVDPDAAEEPFDKLMALSAVEGEASAIRQARARLAMDRIREHARQAGLDKMTIGEIDALIAKVRRERRARR